MSDVLYLLGVPHDQSHQGQLMLDLLSHYSNWIFGIITAAILIATVLRKTFTRLRTALRRLNMVFDTLLGRDEIRHPETNDVLVEATPNLGMRFNRVEEAIVKMSDTHEAVAALTKRVDGLGTLLGDHINTCPPAPVTAVIKATAEAVHDHQVSAQHTP